MLYLVLAVLLLLGVSVAGVAQPPTEGCDTPNPGDHNVGGIMLPFGPMGFQPQTRADYTNWSNCPIFGGGDPIITADHVTCITLTNTCTVGFQCIQTAVGVHGNHVSSGNCSTGGMCNGSRSNIVNSSSSLQPLTVGQNYCFWCGNYGTQAITLTLATQSGDCGALPVDLQSFTID